MRSLRHFNERLSTVRPDDWGVSGDERLSASNKSDDRPEGKRDHLPAAAAGKRRRAARPADFGKALKSVYDDTLREDVPDDFMDLLGKLS
jgi:hypothetical protein